MPTSNNTKAAKIAANPLFSELINRIRRLPIGKEFTVRGCFTEVEWQEAQKENRLSLGRLFKNNVDVSNITGIKPIQRQLNSNTQKYLVVGSVNFTGKFMMNYLGVYESYGALTQELYKVDTAAILFYKMKKINNVLDIEVICKHLNKSKDMIFNVSKKIKIPNTLDYTNQNIPAIIAISFCLKVLWIYESEIETKGIENVYLCSSNRSMLERCSGFRTDTFNNKDYESIIYRYFKDFMVGNDMQLSNKINTIALNQGTYSTFINNF
ncbi:DUF1413 domain-containing protein [Clostridium botulinum]|nr:DUF1413 domain-containing protein [Clostridium botulinum]